MNALTLIQATVEPVNHAGDPVALATQALGRPTRGSQPGAHVWKTLYYHLQIEESGKMHVVYFAQAFGNNLLPGTLYLHPDLDYDIGINALRKTLAALVSLRKNHRRILAAMFNDSYEQAAMLFRDFTGVHTDAVSMRFDLANRSHAERETLKALL